MVPLTEIETAVLEPDALEALVSALRARGYRTVGPKLRDGAIIYDDLNSAAELPIGWTDEQQPGRYRVVVDPYGMRERAASPFRVTIRRDGQPDEVVAGTAQNGRRNQVAAEFTVTPP